MQPSESPAQDVHEPEPEEEPQSSPEAPDEEPSPSWWQRLTSRLRREEEPAEPEEPEPPAEGSQQRTLTQEDINRLVQSEADKREAARNRAARDAERRRLRDEDPWAYVEQEKNEEQAQIAAQQSDAQLTDLLQGIGHAHDEVTLKPLMDTLGSLDPAEHQRLLQMPGAGVGGDGRKLLTTEALKSLEKRWKAEGEKEAEAKLRRNQAFRKQVFSEFSGGMSSPELLPSGSTARNGGRSSQEVNAMLRQQVNLPTS